MPDTATMDAGSSTAGLGPSLRTASLHGHRVSYRTAGEGPVVLLIHGITGDSRQWNQIIPQLADRYTVLAPDLLGHGQSAKPRGDYSLGAYAVSLRDLLIVLGHRRATVVGHSLGGGIAMQFSYEYPVFCERLVLVDSGGLGPEVHPLLRAATLPGAELVLPLIAHSRLHVVGEAIGQALGRLGLELGHDLAEMTRGYASLSDAEARRAFLHTLRAVIDLAGQRVNATDRLYLAQMIPTLIVWGRRDPLIPVGARHGRPPGHARQPAGDLRRRRPLPPARAASSLRPRAHGLHRQHRPGRVRLLRRRPEDAPRANARERRKGAELTKAWGRLRHAGTLTEPRVRDRA